MKKIVKRIIIYVTLFAFIISALSFTCYKSWKLIYENKKKAEELALKYDELLEEEETLSDEVVKLQDKDYIAKYAREKYMYTKDSEVVIDMTNLEDK